MQTKHGEETGKFGKCLTRYLKNKDYFDYFVYYDHGCKQAEPNVTEIRGFFGAEVKNRNRLADVDLLVAKPNKDAVILVEIEERPVSPKKILGDVFAILMCNQFAVKLDGEQQYFRVNAETKLIIAGIALNKGIRLERINEVIIPRLQLFKTPDDSINPKNVNLIFKENISSTIEALKEKIEEILRKLECKHVSDKKS